jgi:hypothetical protein
MTSRCAPKVVVAIDYQRPRVPVRARAEARHRPATRSTIGTRHSLVMVACSSSARKLRQDRARARASPAWLSGRDVGTVPFDIEGTATDYSWRGS